MPTTRTFQLSAELFWGFQVKIELQNIHNMDQVFHIIKLELQRFLTSRNLLVLSEKVDQLALHSHNGDVQDIINNTSEDSIIYLCDHDHGTSQSDRF